MRDRKITTAMRRGWELPVTFEVNKTLCSSELMYAFIEQCQRRRYLAKAVIIAQGEVSRGVYFLITGAATFRMRTETGHDLVLDVAHGGRFFGESGLFEPGIVNNTTVRAKSACDVAFISHARLRGNPNLLAGLMPQLAAQLALRLDDLSRKTAAMAFYEIERRVVNTLHELATAPDARAHSEGRAISITRTELGYMTGASREAVGRVLARLHQRGVVRAKGQAIVILADRSQREIIAPSAPPLEYRAASARARL